MNKETSMALLRLMSRNYFGPLLMALALLVVGQASAQETSPRGVLRVGTTSAPPFAIKEEDGNWYGIGVQLWRELAAELELEFHLEEREFTDLLAGVEDGSLDVGVAAITITADRETVMDFSHPFHTTGIAIAVPFEGTARHWLNVAEHFLSLHFLYVIGALMLVLLLAGFLVWLFERRRNPEMFGDKLPKGLGNGFWWSAVTMTTVGYGDKAPKTLGGRLVALVWMFTSIIILSSFIATITSSLTISQLSGQIQGLSDLKRVRVGTVEGSTSATFLAAQNIAAASFGGTSAGLRALADGDIDAFVQDFPIMKYLVNTQYPGRLQVLPQTFSRQDYGIALTSGSNLREPLNRSLLRHIRSEEWEALLQRYLEP
jgi:ABC-type amino acid transport substrate-binding protein